MPTTVNNPSLPYDRQVVALEAKGQIPFIYNAATEQFEFLASQGNGLLSVANYVWNTGTLSWDKMTPASGGGGGGAVSIADGADVTQGAIADAAVVTDTTGTLSGKLRGLVKWAFERMPTSLGQKVMASSLPVVVASDQSTLNTSDNHTTAGAPLSVRLSDGAAFYTASGGAGGNLATAAKGTTAAGNPTSENTDANTQSLHVRDVNFSVASALGDADANPTTTRVGAHLMGWNAGGAQWERIRASPANADGESGHAQGALDVMSHHYIYNGTNWDRARGTIANGLLVDVSRVQGSVAVTGPLTDAQLRATAVPISGTVAVSNFPASQVVSDGGASITVDGTVALDAGTLAALEVITVVDGGGSLTVDGTVAVSNFPATQAVSDGGGSLTVDGPLTNTELRATPVPVIENVVDRVAAGPVSSSVGVASASLIAANANRTGLVIINLSTANVSLGLDGAAATLNAGITLTPFGVWVMDKYTFTTGAIAAIASAAASTVSIQEFQ